MQPTENTLGSKTWLAAKLTVLWFLLGILSLGLLIGPATAAFYKIMFHVNHTDRIPQKPVHQYFRSIKHTLKDGILVFILAVALFALIYYLYTLATSTWQYVLVYFIGFEALIVTLYTFPILALFKANNIFIHIKTAFLLANLHAFSSLLLVFMIGVMVLASFLYSPITLIFLILPYLFGSATVFHRVLSFYIKT